MGAIVDSRLLSAYQGKRIFITGHTGFKGSWLSYILSEAGAEVMGYALRPLYDNSHFEQLGLQHLLHDVSADIRDSERLTQELKSFRPEFVFHLAAQALVRPSYVDPKATFDINVGGGVNLLEAVRVCDSVRSLVFITSDKCYENLEWIWGYRESDLMGGRDPYSASKGAIELIFSSYLRSYFASTPNLGAGSARAGNVIGGGDWAVDRLIPDCIRALMANQPILIRNRRSTRPWQHVLEPLTGYLQLGIALEREPNSYSGSWNFGPHIGQLQTVEDVVRGMTNFHGRGEVVVDVSQGSPHEAGLLQLNSDKARQLLGWNTRWDFTKTLEATAHWYRDVMFNGVSAAEVTRLQINEYFKDFYD